MRVQRLATATVFAETRKVWGGHISHTTGPIGLKFWIWCCGFPNNMYTYQVSLKSETVGFKFSVIMGDLTRNDPLVLENWYQNAVSPLLRHPLTFHRSVVQFRKELQCNLS